jgi:acyl dehydratase
MSPTTHTPDATEAEAEARLEKLRAFEGRASGTPSEARDPVNQAMIRHWVDAMGDHNPVYVDEAEARANGFPGIVAPPTMLQAWTMRGYRQDPDAPAADDVGGATAVQDQMFALLNAAGFTSVVATDCTQEYARPLVLGDRLTVSSVIESVSPEKHTALGDGHFVTTRMDYVDQDGAPVATMRFRILRFRPRRPTARRYFVPVPPSPTTTPSSSRAPSSGGSSSSGAPRAGRCATRRARRARRAGRSSGTRSPRPVGEPCSATWSSTIPRYPASSTRFPSPWSSWPRGRASSPT